MITKRMKRNMILSLLLIGLGFGDLFLMMNYGIGTKETTLPYWLDMGFLITFFAIPIISSLVVASKVSREYSESEEERRCRTITDVEESNRQRNDELTVYDFKGMCTVEHQDGSVFKINHAYIEQDFTEYYNNETKVKSKNPILVVYSEHNKPMYFYPNDLEYWEFEGKKWTTGNKIWHNLDI